MAELISDARDVAYEEDIIRNPYSMKHWLYYLAYKAEAPREVRYLIYERAVDKLPRSYKLWRSYLKEREQYCKNVPITDVAYEELNNAYERALVHMSRMPYIWKEYLACLVTQKRITLTRHAFDRALKSLPVTQHLKWVWPQYLDFVKKANVPETAIRVFRRYLKIQPTEVEEFIKYLKQTGRLDEAAVLLAKCVNDEDFVSQAGKSKHDMWTELLGLIVKNPRKVVSLNVDAIIRSGIKRFPHEAARLWTSLADYYSLKAHFEQSRSVYEEALMNVMTVRDFSVVFDAYALFMENLLTAKMNEAEEIKQKLDARLRKRTQKNNKKSVKKGRTAAGEDDSASSSSSSSDSESDSDSDSESEDAELREAIRNVDVDIDLRILRLESLTSKRAELLNSVMLRQNPHNVNEWLKRVRLFRGDVGKVIQTYTEAVTTVDPFKAVGKPQELWRRFAGFYEYHEDIGNARVIYDKACSVNFKSIEALAYLWCERIEMELRNGHKNEALVLARRAVMPPKNYMTLEVKADDGQSLRAHQRLYRHTKVWALYLDLEENFNGNDFEPVKKAYEKSLSLKVATPQMVLNYATMLEERKFFEEAFRAYEKGIALFTYPHVGPIWLAYLRKFISRFGGKKLERTREMFKTATKSAPPPEAKKLFLLWAKFEEEHGLARRAMNVYAEGCKRVPMEDRKNMYFIYISRCAEFFGTVKTREIFDEAIKKLPDPDLPAMGMLYAAVERKLGEVDRARAIYLYVAQFCDPRLEVAFWTTWHGFEVAHGNSDTFREMLRVRRTVQAHFAQTGLLTVAMAKAEEEKKRAAAAAKKVAGTETEASAEHALQQKMDKAEELVQLSLGTKRKQPMEGHTETGGAGKRPGIGLTQPNANAMLALEEEAEAAAARVQQKKREQEAMRAAEEAALASKAAENPDEINLDDMGEDEEEIDAGGNTITEKGVPTAVLGGLGSSDTASKSANVIGAMERFKLLQQRVTK